MNQPIHQDAMIADSLSRFAHGNTLDSIPPEVRERAKYLILDAVGIAYASSTYEFARTTMRALASLGTGDGAVIGFPERLTLRDAVLMNGALIHGLDFDDTHLTGVVHATASCFPCALGMAAHLGRTGSDLLAAYVLGMETAARIGAVAKGELNQVGFHPTGVVAAFAAALIAGRLHGLAPEQLTMAQGIVLSMASGTREYSADGAWTKRLHPGWAGAAGITAAALAKEGFSGPRAAYEGRFGLFATHLGAAAAGCDLGAATARLGEKWELMQVALKPFPACQLNIACIDAAIAIATRHPVDPKNVAKIHALIPQHAVKIVCEPIESKRRPGNSYAAQFSIPYAVACALIHRRFGLTEVEKYRDPEILALADKVGYGVDPASGYPKHFSGEVIVTMKDGRTFAHREPVNRGAAERPMSSDEIVSKYRQNAGLALPPGKAEQVRDAVLGIDRGRDARSLARTLALGT